MVNATYRLESPIPNKFSVGERFGIDFVLRLGVIVIVAVMSG